MDASTRLRRAIYLHDLALVDRILGANPQLLTNPDFDDKSNTNLHLAAVLGYLDLAALFIRAGHDATAISRNADHETPLHLAVRNGHVDLAKLLLRTFPHCISFANANGLDALAVAAQSPRSVSLIPLLLRHPHNPVSPNVCDKDGNTPLHHAAASGSLPALRILLAAGANPQAKNNYGWTPLAYSQTVTVEVDFKNLISEWERRSPGVRLVVEPEEPRL